MLSGRIDWEARLIGEVDIFRIDSTHELYAHMNANYVRAARLPDFDHFGEIVDTLARGDGFITTGEVLIPEVTLSAKPPDSITLQATVEWTSPLEFAEIVWGDGSQTHDQILLLDSTRPFGRSLIQSETAAKGWFQMLNHRNPGWLPSAPSSKAAKSRGLVTR
jgi:hypothetical protein